MQDLISTEIAAGILTLLGILALAANRLGFLRFGKNNVDSPVAHSEPCKFDQDKCDEKHKEISEYTHALHTSNELQQQRIDQIDKRLAEGSKNFSVITKNIGDITTNLALQSQSINALTEEIRKNNGKH